MSEQTQDYLVKRMVARSIEDQEPSWKNALSRKFVEFNREDALQEIKDQEEKGFWYSKSGRTAVNAATFFSGYILLGEEMAQGMDSEQYSQVANSIREAFNTVGLQPDTDFFRWQMSDFFVAAYYAWGASSVTRAVFKGLGAKGVLGKDEEWWESKSNMASAFGVGVLLTGYEVVQAAHANGPLDVKDLAAYMAGLGMYLGSEKIWQEYLLFKEKYGLKLSPFMRDRKPQIALAYEESMDATQTLMDQNLSEEINVPRNRPNH